MISHLYSTIISIKQLFFNHFHSIHDFKTVNYGTLLAYVTVTNWMFKVTSFSHGCSSILFRRCIPAAYCGKLIE